MDEGAHIRLYQAWKQFVDTGLLDRQVVRPVVAESWMRCRARGINPYRLRREDRLTGGELDQLFSQNRALIELSRPFIGELNSFLQGTGFLTALCDADGYLLALVGDEDILHYAAVLGDQPGAYWGEERVGTGAISTCLITGEPLQVVGPEHYFADHHTWACSGSPIRGSGTIIGALAVSGPLSAAHQHTLGMTILAAKAIETAWRV
ncbi:MAG: GAF domain-containing protein [Bacillota bacterium]